MPFIIVAALPTRKVCRISMYGTSLLMLSTSFAKYWPSGVRMKVLWRKVARLSQISEYSLPEKDCSLGDDKGVSSLHELRMLFQFIRLLCRFE